MSQLDAAVIVSIVRTPFGRHGGLLATVRPDDLAALVLSEVVRRAQIDPQEVDDVILGCANQAGEDSRDVARNALLLAGFPVSVPGQTVNRLCGSGMQAIVTGCQAIQAGEARVVVAGGVESMSRAPWVMAKPERGFPSGGQAVEDSALGWRFPNPRFEEMHGLASLGETAENVAQRYAITREEQDELALRSHRAAIAAQRSGALAGELLAVEVADRRGRTVTVSEDEGPRAGTDLEALAALRPAFVTAGSVTAGNSSPLSDGAAAVVLTSASEAARRGIRPLASFVGAAVAGVDPSFMGIGPVPATQRLLSRPGMPDIAEIDLIELNEAFASQAVACARMLGLDWERVNVNGGALALGHPLGASGARLVGTLGRELQARGVRYGLSTMCIGVGQGISALWARADA